MERFDVVLMAGSNPLGMALSRLSTHSTAAAATVSAKKHRAEQSRAGAHFQTVAIRIFEIDEDGDESLVGCLMPAPDAR